MSGIRKSLFSTGVVLAFLVTVWKLQGCCNRPSHGEIGTSEINTRIKRTEDISGKHSPKQNPEVLPDICMKEERMSHLHTVCQHNRRAFLNTKVAFGKQFIVDDEQKVVYCQVPNIGSHSIKSAIVQANLNKQKPRVLDLKKPVMGNWEHGLEHYGLTHMTKLMPMYRNYSKFLIVRHPLDRILSAYSNLKNHGFQYQRATIQHFLHRFNLNDMRNLTLQQFFQVITEPGNSPSGVYNNPHWKSITEICFPCHIKYNSILRLETFRPDSNYLNRMNISPAELPHLNKNQHTEKSLHYGVKYLHILSKLPAEIVTKLQGRYQLDMDLFGYGYDELTQIASCSISKKGTGRRCC